jgi:hypothetical protein
MQSLRGATIGTPNILGRGVSGDAEYLVIVHLSAEPP